VLKSEIKAITARNAIKIIYFEICEAARELPNFS